MPSAFRFSINTERKLDIFKSQPYQESPITDRDIGKNVEVTVIQPHHNKMFIRTVSAKGPELMEMAHLQCILERKNCKHLSPFQNPQVWPLSGRPPQAVNGDLGAVAAAALAPQVQADELRTGSQHSIQPIIIHLVAGLAIKNPSKKSYPKNPKKTHIKNQLKLFFFSSK
jgi:hypothetical protein